MSDDYNKFLDKLQCQFLSCYPIHHMDWQEIETNLTWEHQEDIIKKTFKHPLNKEKPIKNDYQIYFLKKLLQLMEDKNQEINDDFYDHICKLQQRPLDHNPDKFVYKHYVVPAYRTKLTLRESKKIVGDGNTGLCTWQAALALTDYLLHNKNIVLNKCVLELGAGTGLCGLMLMQCCEPKSIMLTDGSEDCIELIRENLLENIKNAQKEADGTFRMKERQISACQLAWDAVDTTEWVQKVKPDILLAADVIYDDTAFKDLIKAIEFFFNQTKNNIKMFLAATVRNENTLSIFTALLESLNFQMEKLDLVPNENSHLFWYRATPVTILLVTRNSDDNN